jgi:DNA-binding NarL/FixJ family response regulator
MVKHDPNPSNTTPAARLARCVIVEDHQMFADLLAMTFTASPDVALEIVEIAPSVAAGIAACDRHKPDLVMLDLALPDGTGDAVAKHVAATLPEARVIVVSGQSGTFVCLPELAPRIDGVVSKTDAFRALQVLLADLFHSTAGIKAPAGSSSDRRRLTSILTKREREVFGLIAQRLSTPRIADRLGLSRHTINAHRKNIASKLGIQGSDLPLVAYEYRKQLTGHP